MCASVHNIFAVARAFHYSMKIPCTTSSTLEECYGCKVGQEMLHFERVMKFVLTYGFKFFIILQ